MPPKESSDRYLILSLSARVLAGSLSASGFSVAAIDVFCDQDLCQILKVDNYQKVPVFDTPNILRAIHEINEKTPCKYLIYGGGLESCSELLDQLPDNLTLLGNPESLLKRIKKPQTFFTLLDTLGIPHPETIFSSPKKGKDWLVKQADSCGGAGVTKFDPAQTYSSSCYFQRFISGRVYSVVFVADGQKAIVVGYNEIWAESDSSFSFAGAITLPNFPEGLNNIINNYVQILMNNLELVGLCGLDFIIDAQQQIQLIEINPRPTATFELHDQKGDLMSKHIKACQFKKLEPVKKNNPDHAYAKQVYYSEKPLKIDQETEWPEWTADLPHGGQIIKAREPVCTVYAEGENVSETKKLLKERILLVKKCLS